MKSHQISWNLDKFRIKDWPFGIIVTRHFSLKSSYLNDKEYCKSIDRTLKMLFNETSDSFLRLTIPELCKLLVVDKINKYEMVSKMFSSKNNSFYSLQKVSKNAVLNTRLQICDEIYLTKATNRNLSI